MDRIAVKRLRSSDLTFFQSQYEHQHEQAELIGRTGTRQKGVGLDSRTLIDLFYPTLPDQTYPVELLILGPGSIRPWPSPGAMVRLWAKNWRLGGCTVRNPASDPHRFDALEEGDLAVMLFIGQDKPEAIRMCLIPHTDPLWPLWSEGFGGRNGLVPLPMNQFLAVLSDPDYAEHPIVDILEDIDLDLLEAEQADRVRRFRGFSTRRMADHSEQQRLNGQYGEELVNRYLAAQLNANQITWFEWTSRTYPTAPYDFRIIRSGGAEEFVDVKSTSSNLNQPFHVSPAEMEWAKKSESYQIYRVSSVSPESGVLTVMHGLEVLAKRILTATYPIGVEVEGYLIRPERSGLESEPFVYLGSEPEVVKSEDPDREEEVEVEEMDQIETEWPDGTEYLAIG